MDCEKKLFTCSFCTFTAPTKTRVRYHELAIHSDLRPWPCTFPGCTHRAKRKCHLEQHIRIHETVLEIRKPYCCSFKHCDFRTPNKFALKGHTLTKHTPGRTRDFQCVLCPSKFFSERKLTFHIRGHVKEKLFKCPQCDFTTHLSSYIPCHVRNVHERLNTFTCTFSGCNYSTYYKSGFNQHSRSHSTDLVVRRPVPCTFSGCDYRTINMYCLKKHIHCRHNPALTKEVQCPMCPKRFYCKSGLNHHVKGFHLNEKPYKCDKCSYATTTSTLLERHQQRRHERGKPNAKFVCNLCGYGAFSKSESQRHYKTIHTKERKFKCSHSGCDYQTNSGHILRNHQLIHEEDPERRFPIVCSFPGCDFRRRVNSDMKKHEKVHKESKLRLQCELCPARLYPDSKSLKFHKHMNHTQGRYECSYCVFACMQKQFLTSHIRKHHTNPSKNYVKASAVTPSRGILGATPKDSMPLRSCSNTTSQLSALKDAFSCKIPIVVLERIALGSLK